jgi:hypothetical protein
VKGLPTPGGVARPIELPPFLNVGLRKVTSGVGPQVSASKAVLSPGQAVRGKEVLRDRLLFSLVVDDSEHAVLPP